VEWENELLNAVAGGRRGDLKDKGAGAGTFPRAPLKEDDRGEGRDGDEANPWAGACRPPDGDGRPNPGDAPL